MCGADGIGPERSGWTGSSGDGFTCRARWATGGPRGAGGGGHCGGGGDGRAGTQVEAMVTLKAANRSRQEKYELRIQKLHETFPKFWWIIGLADIRMRSEHLERIRRKLMREATQVPAGGLPTKGAYDPNKPWDLAFREAARDELFWTEHVDRKALLFAAQLQSAAQLVDSGVGEVVQALSAVGPAVKLPKKRKAADSDSSSSHVKAEKKKKKKKKPKKRAKKTGPPSGGNAPGKGAGGKGAAKHSDGRFFRDEAGKQICWTWNHSADGCSTPCPADRVHKCEWCRGSHRSLACNKKPEGWAP